MRSRLIKFRRLIGIRRIIEDSSSPLLSGFALWRNSPAFFRKPLRQQGLEALGHRWVQAHSLTVLKGGDLPEWSSQIVVVEDQHVWELAESGLEIGQSAGETGDQFLGRVPALGNAHGHALFGN